MQLPHLEVWFQRATDVVRKLLYGDVDIGIVGFDMYSEIADKSSEVVVVHDALGFGGCHLGLGIPTSGRFADINSLDELRRSDLLLSRAAQVMPLMLSTSSALLGQQRFTPTPCIIPLRYRSSTSNN